MQAACLRSIQISTPVDGEEPGELPIPGTAETSLRDRVPPDLRGSASAEHDRMRAEAIDA